MASAFARCLLCLQPTSMESRIILSTPSSGVLAAARPDLAEYVLK